MTDIETTPASPAPVADDAPSQDQLVEEGDIAADYIEELLDIADLDGDIEIDARAGRAYLSVTATGESNLRMLSSSDAVNALQELTRLAVQNRTGRFSRLILDVGGSRDARAAELARIVDHAIERIEAGAASASIGPFRSSASTGASPLIPARKFRRSDSGQ